MGKRTLKKQRINILQNGVVVTVVRTVHDIVRDEGALVYHGWVQIDNREIWCRQHRNSRVWEDDASYRRRFHCGF